MKNALKILSLSITVFTLPAQEFSFQMYFSDAAGNKDTITIGYDSIATNGIDTAFGERNIIAVKTDKPFDVRISDEWATRRFGGPPGSFHTKKQILDFACRQWISEIQGIDVFCMNWPVTMQWDTSLFKSECLEGSLITCVDPGGWWDVGCASNYFVQLFGNGGSLSFTSNNGSKGIHDGYVNDFNDTITYYYLILGGEGILHSAVNDEFKTTNQIKVIPNPVENKLTLKTTESFGIPESIGVITITGQYLLHTETNDDIDVSSLPSGIYLINVRNEKNGKAVAKFLKL